MSADLTHIDTWVFDLDNTLYPSACDLFAQIDVRMTQFVAQELNVDLVEARVLQKRYYAEDGTTLNGLMRRHGVAPDAYLDFVHDIDLSPIESCSTLRAEVEALPGRRLVFTNGSVAHAERVLEKRGLTGLFEGVFDIAAARYAPKPFPDAYARFIDAHDIQPTSAAFFEDIARNLTEPHALGFTTVLVRTDKDWSHEPAGVRPAGVDETHDHVHHATNDLTAFLATSRHAGRAPSDA